MRQEVILVPKEEFMIPENCWAFIEEEDGTRKLVTTRSVNASEAKKLVLVPKIAGG